MARVDRLLFTCEHGGNRIPVPYAAAFRGAAALLASHRGYDPGALALARWLARRAKAPLYAVAVSRLLIDLNRSLHHPRLFSEISTALDDQEQRRIIKRYYQAHRWRVEEAILTHAATGGRVVHVAVHSFTPVLAREVRRADIGLLYDPARPAEKTLCRQWAVRLREIAPDLRVRRNYPYRGRADGFTTYLRTRFGARRYLGIELEVNQACLQAPPAAARVRAALARLLIEPSEASRSA
jgi:predicted N-formylglutamate amidohydrolase